MKKVYIIGFKKLKTTLYDFLSELFILYEAQKARASSYFIMRKLFIYDTITLFTFPDHCLLTTDHLKIHFISFQF